MAESLGIPAVPSAPELRRPTERPRFGRERAGPIRSSFYLYRAVPEDLRGAYFADDRPWVVGFSGGKDSTCLMEFVYYMLARLPAAQRVKPVYVLASDTRVEVPSISRRIRRELALIGAAAERDGLPITTHLVFPKLNDTFWVNLIGCGYPSPTTQFRWCTDRLKIHPVSEFIRSIVDQRGTVVVVLGARRDESDTRARTMNTASIDAQRIRLILYYHCGHDDWKNPDGWWRHTGYDPKNPQKFLDNWCAITSEVGNRYGKGLAGWYFDDACVFYPLNPDFRRLTLAAKAGNPDRVVCYNPWVLPRSTDFQDYLCGEGYDFLKLWDGLPADGTGIYASGPYKGLQAHTNFVLERSWVHSRLDTDIPAPPYKKEQFVQDMKAGIAHGIVPSVNLEIYQDVGVGEASLEYMKAVKQELNRTQQR